MLEFLIITVCMHGVTTSGCSSSTAAYYEYNQDVKRVVANAEKIGKKIVNNNEWVVYAATPFAAAATGKTANFNLSKGFMLNLNVRNQMVGIQWNY